MVIAEIGQTEAVDEGGRVGECGIARKDLVRDAEFVEVRSDGRERGVLRQSVKSLAGAVVNRQIRSVAIR